MFWLLWFLQFGLFGWDHPSIFGSSFVCLRSRFIPTRLFVITCIVCKWRLYSVIQFTSLLTICSILVGCVSMRREQWILSVNWRSKTIIMLLSLKPILWSSWRSFITRKCIWRLGSYFFFPCVTFATSFIW